jgi:hypothetical protein
MAAEDKSRRLPLRPVIECFRGVELAADEQSRLLALFQSAVRSIEGSHVREARFYTDDFEAVESRRAVGFVLTVRRIVSGGSTLWQGAFERAGQRLDVLGSTEGEDRDRAEDRNRPPDNVASTSVSGIPEPSPRYNAAFIFQRRRT